MKTDELAEMQAMMSLGVSEKEMDDLSRLLDRAARGDRRAIVELDRLGRDPNSLVSRARAVLG